MTDYIVHSRHDTHVGVKAKTAAGHEVVGAMPASIVELVPVDGDGPSITLHQHAVLPGSQDKINEVFQVGAVVRMGDFTVVEPPKKKKKAKGKDAPAAEEAAAT